MTGHLEDLARGIAWIKEQVSAQGRDASGLDFAYSIVLGPVDPERERARMRVTGSAYVPRRAVQTPQEAIDTIRQHREAGFDHLCIGFNWENPEALMRQMEDFAVSVMPAFQG